VATTLDELLEVAGVRFSALEEQQLIRRTKTAHNPRTKARFSTPRVVYRNRFATLDKSARRVS
jgi:hypothetical protein